MPLSWQDRLDSAATEGEVISIARDFIAQFSPQEIERLPKPCRPGKFFEANDVTSHALALVRHNCDREDETAALVHRFASFFSNASTRLSRIMASSNGYEAGRDATQQSA